MKVSDEMLKTALVAYFDGEHSWDAGMSKRSIEMVRRSMAAALEAALAVSPPQEPRNLPGKIADELGVTPHSDMRPYIVRAVALALERASPPGEQWRKDDAND